MKYILLALISISLLNSGCATAPAAQTDADTAQLEKELTPEPTAQPAAESGTVKNADADAESQEENTQALTRFSDLNNMAPPSDRQYRRMTRQRMEEESQLNSSAGSLWRMEGQTSYLFAENKHRQVGDATAVKLEGSALKMVEHKAYVISDLLVKLEEQKRQAEEEARKAEEERRRLAQLEAERKLRAEQIARGEIVVDPLDEEQAQQDAAAAAAARQPASVNTAAAKKTTEEKIDLKEVETIPVRIVERRGDNTYRVRGEQFLTIKKRPYKVITTGLIRAEDFKDSEISSNKLLEAQYDVVHVKRSINE